MSDIDELRRSIEDFDLEEPVDDIDIDIDFTDKEPRPKKSRRILGMRTSEFAVLMVMALIALIILVAAVLVASGRVGI
jgi:hypothetical protein